MGLAFRKYEGLGNDFIVVDADQEDAVGVALARDLCDRRFGVGADGVLVVLPAASAGAAARMRVINADGSVPEMCGNGLRCVALHLAHTRRAGPRLVVDTDAGPKPCAVTTPAPGEASVQIDMGEIATGEDVSLEVDGEVWSFVTADAGNPHAITAQPATEAVIAKVGPRVATDARFPSGTNVEFASFREGAVDLVVWERGVGVTLACGTGACATVAVGVTRGFLKRNDEVPVHLPGGTLFVRVDDAGRAAMRGPARLVFSGVWERR